ncbi:hypothetical protein [Neisseria sicca]|nr:hypothetical protein [Neisseria sicca]
MILLGGAKVGLRSSENRFQTTFVLMSVYSIYRVNTLNMDNIL